MSTGGLFVALAGMIVGLSCFSFILYVVYVIGLWKMFEKLGLEGWKYYEIGRASLGKECRSRWSPYH